MGLLLCEGKKSFWWSFYSRQASAVLTDQAPCPSTEVAGMEPVSGHARIWFPPKAMFLPGSCTPQVWHPADSFSFWLPHSWERVQRLEALWHSQGGGLLRVFCTISDFSQLLSSLMAQLSHWPPRNQLHIVELHLSSENRTIELVTKPSWFSFYYEK